MPKHGATLGGLGLQVCTKLELGQAPVAWCGHANTTTGALVTPRGGRAIDNGGLQGCLPPDASGPLLLSGQPRRWKVMLLHEDQVRTQRSGRQVVGQWAPCSAVDRVDVECIKPAAEPT